LFTWILGTHWWKEKKKTLKVLFYPLCMPSELPADPSINTRYIHVKKKKKKTVMLRSCNQASRRLSGEGLRI
jgi:hypothetical protein